MEKYIQILLIDYDPDDREIFIMILKQINRNINCLTAGNGEEALSLLEANKQYLPDYIFPDVNMPRMNGFECLKKVKSLSRLKESKVYMIQQLLITACWKKEKRRGQSA